MSDINQQKKRKNQQWKLAAQAKKLKKQQDRLKQKQKEKQPVKQIKSKQKLPQKQIKQQPIPIQIKVNPSLPDPQIKKSLDQLFKCSISLKHKNQKDLNSLRKLLLQYTHQFLKSQDEVLLASSHQIIKQWNQLNIGAVIDIWDISTKSNRKKNIIKTRFEDISYFKNTISKIACGATYIFQNGLVASDPGTLFLAMLAYQYRIPFIVLCQTYRYRDVAFLQDDLIEETNQYDFINPKYISLLITEAGPINVCSIPTLVSQFYKQLL